MGFSEAHDTFAPGLLRAYRPFSATLCVGQHIFSRAVKELENTSSDDMSNEVITNVDVFGSCMVVVISGKL